jgi:hypothetical protein
MVHVDSIRQNPKYKLPTHGMSHIPNNVIFRNDLYVVNYIADEKEVGD